MWETELDGFRADHQVISDDGRYVYTSDTLANRVWKIDTATGERVGGAWVADFPHGNHLHQIPGMGDEPTFVNGSLGNMLAPDAADGRHRLTFVDPETMAVKRTVDFDEGVRPFVFGPDARTVYIQISYVHGFHEYDLVDDRITRTRILPQTDAVPEDEDDYPLQSAQHGIDLRPDGEYICVAGTTTNAVFVVWRSDLALLNTIPVGKHPLLGPELLGRRARIRRRQRRRPRFGGRLLGRCGDRRGAGECGPDGDGDAGGVKFDSD